MKFSLMERGYGLLTGLIVLGLAANAKADYTIQDIGFQNQTDIVFATNLNSTGQVVGAYVRQGEGLYRGFVWSGDTGMVDIGNLGLDALPHAINSQGDIVGESTAVHQNFPQAFLKLHGQDVQALTPAGPNASAVAINEAGDVGLNLSEVAFVYRNGNLTPLQSFGQRSIVSSMNSLGEISGNASINNDTFAVKWSTTGAITVLDSGSAVAINDIGDIAINSYQASYIRLHGGGTAILGGDLRAMNNRDDVIGYQNSVPTVWLGGNSQGTNLLSAIENSAGWSIQGVSGINDRGQIVGYGTFNGARRGFILNPVPEPATFSALALGVVVLGCRRQRRK